MDLAERDEFRDWDQVAQAVANLPAEGVEHFLASLVTQWAIAGRDPGELAEFFASELRNVRGTGDTDEQGRRGKKRIEVSRKAQAQ